MAVQVVHSENVETWQMFNLGNTVLVTDGWTEGYNETNIHDYATVSFVEQEGSPNLLAYHPSTFTVSLFVVHELKQACPVKSGILLLARDNWRCMLNRELFF